MAKEIINAFHPDYVKTYHPEFITSLRSESAQKVNGEKYGSMSRATRESVADQKYSAITKFPKTKKRVSTAVTEFHIYSKAGMPKGVK